MKTITVALVALLLMVVVAEAQVFDGARVTVTKVKPKMTYWSNTLSDTLICVGGANDTSTVSPTFNVSEFPGHVLLVKTRADSIPNKDTPDNLFIESRARWDSEMPWAQATWARYDTIAGNAWTAAGPYYSFQHRFIYALHSAAASATAMTHPHPYEIQFRAIATDANTCSTMVSWRLSAP